jgi:uncharacterized membrane protein YfcA
VEFIVLVFGGFFAGVLGGLLGIGGGIVMMPLLRFFVGLSPALAAGTCVLAVFFTTLGGSFRHYKLGHIELRPILPVMLAGAFSTVVFSLVFLYFVKRQRWLDFGAGLTFALVSVRMIVEGWRQFRKASCGMRGGGIEQSKTMGIGGSLFGKIAIGGVAGILPGFLGIGTGAILVPAFALILRAPVKIAIGSSLGCFCANAFLSSAFKYFQGFTVLGVAFPLCIGALVGANFGAVLNRRFPAAWLKIMFGAVFLYVSAKYILLFWGYEV